MLLMVIYRLSGCINDMIYEIVSGKGLGPVWPNRIKSEIKENHYYSSSMTTYFI